MRRVLAAMRKRVANGLSLLATGAVAFGFAGPGGSQSPKVADGSAVWRGNAQGFRIAVQGFSNPATVRSFTNRLRQYSLVPGRFAKAVIPLTYPDQFRGGAFISGTVLTVLTQNRSSVGAVAGILNPGSTFSGPGIMRNTRIVRQLASARPDGLPGGIGTYLLDVDQTVGSSTMPVMITGALADTFLPYPYTFQLGLEPRFQNAFTGLDRRIPVTFGGLKTVSYDPATWVARFTGTVSGGVLKVAGVTNEIREGAIVNAAVGFPAVPDDLVVGPKVGSTGAYQVGYNRGGHFVQATSLSIARQGMIAALGQIVSDTVDAGDVIPAEAFYGIWESIETPSAAANDLPAVRNSAGFLNRYEGFIDNAGSTGTPASASASNLVLTASSITRYGPNGSEQGITPAFMLWQVPSTTRAIAIVGDSIAYGVGSGVPHPNSHGDAQGDARGNSGYIEIGLYEQARANEAFCLCRGSDRAQNLVWSPRNWQYRRQLFALSNPTGFINEMGHNDIAAGVSVYARRPDTAYQQGVALFAGTNVYVVAKSGTTGSGTPVSTTSGEDIADGSAMLRYLGQREAAGGANDAVVGQALALLGYNDVANRALQAMARQPLVLAMTQITPGSTATNGFVDGRGQQVAGPWRGVATLRSRYNGLLASMPTGFLPYRLLNPNLYVEGAAEEPGAHPDGTGYWLWDGTPYPVSYDGIHPNSHGQAMASQAVTPGFDR